MPYPADLEGKYLDFTLDGGLRGTASTEGLTPDEDGFLPDQTTPKTVQVYRHEATANGVLTLVADGPAWEFLFLKYIEGFVTTASLAWGPVLTGPMSGCRLCSYTYRGRQRFAHIGTGPAQSPKTADVKWDWKLFIETLQPLSVKGFDPFSCFTTAEIGAQQQLGGVPDVMGHFDGMSAYAMVLAPLSESESSLNKRIVKVGRVERVELRPWSQLAWPEVSSGTSSGGRRRWRSAIRSVIQRLR